MAPVWSVDPIAFTITWFDLNLPVRYYGIIFSLVLVGGFYLFRWQILRAKGKEDEATSFILPGIVGVVLGARLGHVLFYNFDKFMNDPAWIIRIWEGGLASHGALVGLMLALWYHSYRWKRPFWEVTDRFCFSGALGATLVRLANFINSEIVGRTTDSKWGVRFPYFDGLPAELTPPRFPTQLLEVSLGLFLFGALLWLDLRFGGEKRPTGLLSAAFLIIYFSGRFLIEFLKERHGDMDTLLLSRGQILSLPGVFLGFCLLFWVLSKNKRQT